jgi:hypothetical protein
MDGWWRRVISVSLQSKPSYLLIFFMMTCFCMALELCAPLVAEAQEVMRPMVIDDEVALYSHPRSGLKPIYILRLGDEVQVSERIVQGFRIVEFNAYGKKRRGYAQEVELLGRGSQWPQKSSARKSSLFVSGVYSQQKQGSRELQTNPYSIYKVGDFEGASQFLAFGYDWYLNQRFTVRLGYVQRTVLIEGNATQLGSSTVYEFELEQKYHGFLLGLKYSGSSWRGWSILGELEYDRSFEQNFKSLSGPTVDDSQMKDVKNLTLSGVVLYNYGLNRKFAVEPALRLGSIVSAQPYILLTEAQLSAHYVW